MFETVFPQTVPHVVEYRNWTVPTTAPLEVLTEALHFVIALFAHPVVSGLVPS